MSLVRSRMPVYLSILVITFAVMGLLGFQILTEKKASSALLEEKESEILTVHRELQIVIKKSDELRLSYGKLDTEKTNLNTQLVGLKKQLVQLDQNRSISEREKKMITLDLQGKKKELNDLRQRLIKLENNEQEIKKLKQQLVNLEEKLRSAEVEHVEQVRNLNKERAGSLADLQKEIERLKVENAQIAENLRTELSKKDLQKQDKEKETPTLQDLEKGLNVVDPESAGRPKEEDNETTEKDKPEMKEGKDSINGSKPIQEETIKIVQGKENQLGDHDHVHDVKDDNAAFTDPAREDGTEPGEGEKDKKIKFQDQDEERPKKEEQLEHEMDESDDSLVEKIRLEEDVNEDADGGATE